MNRFVPSIFCFSTAEACRLWWNCEKSSPHGEAGLFGPSRLEIFFSHLKDRMNSSGAKGDPSSGT